MTYAYACPSNHQQDYVCAAGQQPETLTCHICDGIARRDYATEFASVKFGIIDPYRNYHLSSHKMRVEGEQQRVLDAPADNFERRVMEKTFGRTYIGNETGHMSERGQKAIAEYKERKRAGEAV